jgi:hypothetical protein
MTGIRRREQKAIEQKAIEQKAKSYCSGFCPAQDSPDFTDLFFFLIIKRLAKINIC